MSSHKRLSLYVIVASVVLLLLAACGEATTPTPTATTAADTGGGAAGAATPTPIPTATPLPSGEMPQYGGIYRRTDYATNHPDPYHVLTRSSHTLNTQFDRLIGHLKPHSFGMEVDLVPSLATEWSLDETATKWTFKLREGVTWHDGEVFDASDVVATIERALDPALLVGRYPIQLRSIVDSMTVVDPYTIILDTGEPNATAIPWLSNWAMAILPEHIITDPNPGPDDSGWLWMQPRVDDPDFGKGSGTLLIGTGPFIMTNFEAAALLTMKRNPNYWMFDEFGQQLPYLDGIVDDTPSAFDRTRHFAEFATGITHQLNAGSGLSDLKAAVLCGRRPDGCHIDLIEHGYFYILLNDRVAPFDDPNIREAARWAMDVYKSSFLPFGQTGSHGQWMHFLFPEATLTNEELYAIAPWLDVDDREFIPPDKWQDKAKERLAELGFPDGVDLQFPWYQSIAPLWRDMQGNLSTDMAAAGFKFDSASDSGRNEQLRGGLWNIKTGQCASPLVDPTAAIAMGGLSWSSPIGSRPWAWEGVEHVDEVYTEANKTLDPIVRGENLKELERWWLEPDRSNFAQTWTLQWFTVPDCVKDFQLGPGLYGSKEMAHVWLTDEAFCHKLYENDLDLIEPKNLNVVQSIMWNWQ